MVSSGVFFFFFFSFFEIFMFQAVRAVNGAKTGPIRQKILSVMLHISATIHHMILFTVHICKMITSAGFFFIFSKLLFSGSRGVGKRAKKTQNDKKCLTLYFRNNISYDCDLWYTCVKWWYLQQIFSIFEILIVEVFRRRRQKGKKWPKISN